MTDTITHAPITLDEALDGFRHVLTETGRDHTYLNGNVPSDVCRYLADDNAESPVPSCLVARIAAHVRPDTWADFEFIVDNEVASRLPDRYATPDAVKFLGEIQAMQDKRQPYGEIFDYGIAVVVPAIRAGTYEMSARVRVAANL